jgi:alpha-L-rhamnosidase
MVRLAMAMGGLAMTAQDEAIRAENLRCEYARNPLGVDVARPRLSWTLESARRGASQAAYQIQVGSRAGEADLWDSGRVESAESIHIPYGGRELEPVRRAFWRVRVWDEAGRASGWSDSAYWETGLIRPEEWKAQWIAFSEAVSQDLGALLQGARWIWFPEEEPPAERRYFRRSFKIDGAVRSAKMVMTVDDQFELYVNGKQVAKSEAVTDAWKELQEFDLRAHLVPGDNLIAVKGNNKGGPAGVLGRLALQLESGGLDIVTDKSWKAINELQPAWQKPGFDDSAWPAAREFAAAGEGPWHGLGAVTPSPLMRKSFTLDQPVKRARLFSTALGLYELRLNGAKVGRGVLAPECTDLHKRVQYQTHDVTDLLRPGENVLGAILGDGWFNGKFGWLSRARNPYRSGPIRLLAQLEIELADGSRRLVLSDETWKGAAGPVVKNDLMDGELYDARLEKPGWDAPGYKEDGWASVEPNPDPKKRKIVSQLGPRAEVLELLKPVSVVERDPGIFIFDLGQNMVGWVRLKVKGPAGTQVTIRHAEILDKEGRLYTVNLRTARATDRYILKGSGEETYEPRFTFHGFRYVELTGYPGKPDLDAVTGCAVYSAMAPAGRFECSHALLNRLQSNIVWGQRGNYLSIPTDCPQRDERLGWMGDAQVFIRTGSFNYDVAGFFTKWMVDVEDGQTADGAFPDVAPRVDVPADGAPAWADAGVIVPWTVWQVYGDTRIVERHYPAMVRWVEHVRRANPDLIWKRRVGNNYGDWIPPYVVPKEDLAAVKTVCATAWFARSAKLLSEMAGAIGRQEDAKKYSELYESIKKAFNEAFVGPDGRIQGNWQTNYVLAIRFGLVAPETAAKHLVEDIEKRRAGHLCVGFMGAPHILPALSQIGRTDLAYKLLTNDTYPSWLYPVKHGGATTIWERWDAWKDGEFQNPSMNSFNHYAYGSVGEWIYSTLGGIDLLEPGFRRIRIRPQPGGGIAGAAAEYDSIRGRIRCSWKLQGGAFSMDVRIPVGAAAEVWVPAKDPTEVREGEGPAAKAPGVRFLRVQEGCAVFEAGAGVYRFTCP